MICIIRKSTRAQTAGCSDLLSDTDRAKPSGSTVSITVKTLPALCASLQPLPHGERRLIRAATRASSGAVGQPQRGGDEAEGGCHTRQVIRPEQTSARRHAGAATAKISVNIGDHGGESRRRRYRSTNCGPTSPRIAHSAIYMVIKTDKT